MYELAKKWCNCTWIRALVIRLVQTVVASLDCPIESSWSGRLYRNMNSRLDMTHQTFEKTMGSVLSGPYQFNPIKRLVILTTERALHAARNVLTWGQDLTGYKKPLCAASKTVSLSIGMSEKCWIRVYMFVVVRTVRSVIATVIRKVISSLFSRHILTLKEQGEESCLLCQWLWDN